MTTQVTPDQQLFIKVINYNFVTHIFLSFNKTTLTLDTRFKLTIINNSHTTLNYITKNFEVILSSLALSPLI